MVLLLPSFSSGFPIRPKPPPLALIDRVLSAASYTPNSFSTRFDSLDIFPLDSSSSSEISMKNRSCRNTTGSGIIPVVFWSSFEAFYRSLSYSFELLKSIPTKSFGESLKLIS